MKILSLIGNNSKCGANYVHYILSKNISTWDVISLKGVDNKFFDCNLKHNFKFNVVFFFYHLFCSKKIQELINDYDVLLADGILSYLLAKRLNELNNSRFKVFALVHNDFTINNRTRWNFIPQFLFNIIYDYSLKGLTVITTSKSAQEALKKRGIEAINIDNGVLKPDCKNESDSVNRIWYVGRLISIKQVDMLVRSLSIINEPYEFNLVGDGPEREKIIALCEKLNVNFRYLGYQDKPFLNFSSGDIFVLPSLIEGRSIALMEAMLCGAYCIVSDIDANKEFLKFGAMTHLVNSECDLLEKLEASLALSKEKRVDYVNKFNLEPLTASFMVEKYMRTFND